MGVGHLIPLKSAISSVPLFATNNDLPTMPANLQQKLEEYDKIRAQKTGYRADWYKKFTTLAMKDEDIDNLLNNHIDSFYADLVRIYRKSKGYVDDFDNFPDSVKLALFDMIFNLGPRKIVDVFVSFNQSIKKGDWRNAATQSNRPQVPAERNQYVNQLLISAAQEKK